MKYKLIKKGELITGYSVDENGEYTAEEAKRILTCQNIDATESDYNNKIAQNEKDFTANEYARNRKIAYDSVGDQLDMIMKDNRDGTKTHQTACEAIKKKYPKN